MFKKPHEIIDTLINNGNKKASIPTLKLILLSFLAGAYIAFGGLLAIKIGGGLPEIKAENIGLSSFLFGAVFPVGLMFVIIAGGELFTGNTALFIPPLYKKKVSIRGVLKNWGVSYIGNFIGSIFVAFFFVYLTKLFSTSPYLQVCQNIALGKINQEFHVLLLKAIACNWLVCLAIWLATSAEQVGGKILAIWFPIMAFVAIGFEHSVANMFFIPLGIFYGADISWTDFFINNLIPVTIGNIIGGSLFVGLVYTYIYEKK